MIPFPTEVWAADAVDRVSEHPVSYAIWWVVFVVFSMIAAYLIVRAGSLAYFRTKLEHLRATLREMREGERHNGEEE